MKRYFLMSLMVMVTMMSMAQPPRDHRGPLVKDNHRPGRPEMRDDRRGRGFDCATREELNMVLHVLEDQPFDDKKLEVAKVCVMLGHFCSEDLGRMARTFSFDDNRKKFLVFAYDFCADPQNYYILRDVFEFRNNFDEMLDELHPRGRR